MIDPIVLWEVLIEALPRLSRDRRAQLRAALDEHDDGGRLIAPEDYAKRRSISISTVRQAYRDGRLECVRFGRAVRIPADALIVPRSSTTTADQRERHWGLVTGGRS
ncbi:MAG: hypothetical protein AB7T06_20860 [Kofleriaceae bacterium]